MNELKPGYYVFFLNSGDIITLERISHKKDLGGDSIAKVSYLYTSFKSQTKQSTTWRDTTFNILQPPDFLILPGGV